MLCGWASIDERGKIKGGKAGDQMGREVKTGQWYYFKQTACLRWHSRELAKEYAKVIKALCNNDCIGYDQGQRTSLYNALKHLKWDYTKLKEKVECDCSELIACAVNCALKRSAVPSSVYTGNLTVALINTGYFSKKTDEKYCKKPDYLLTGDILNAPGHHVISVLEDGSKAGTVTEKAEDGRKAAEPTLYRGSTGSRVRTLQSNLNTLKITDSEGKALKVDGQFGACTKEAVKKFQKKYDLVIDGCYGPKSYKKMKELIEK